MLEIERARHRSGRAWAVAAAVAAAVVLAFCLYDADATTGLNGRPSIQRATAY